MQLAHSGKVTSKGNSIVFEYTRDGQTRDIYFGCWHAINCSLRLDHTRDNFSSKPNNFNVDFIIDAIEMSSKNPGEVESTRQSEDCQCSARKYKHLACCKLSSFCPDCDMLERSSRYCDDCDSFTGNYIRPIMGIDTFYARSLF